MKNEKFSVSLIECTPRSIAPTLEACWVSIFKAFQSSFIKLFLDKKYFNVSKIYFPVSPYRADSPMIIIGLFDFLIFSEISCVPYAIALINEVLEARFIYGYVKSPGSPIE